MKNIVIGLFCLMLSNIFLGVAISKLKNEFSFKLLIKGIIKAICVAIGCFFNYICGSLNPDLIVCKIGNTNMNLNEAMHYIFVIGIMVYSYKALTKLIEVLKINITIEKPDDVTMIEVPIENNIRGENNV